VSILVVAPHGLDEVLGCGGTVCRHVADGLPVEVLILFGDGTGRDAARRRAAEDAARLLGARDPRFAGFPENRGDTIALVDLIMSVERAIGEVRPDTVYLPHPGNLNQDHQAAGRAVATAARPVPGGPVRKLLAYEIASSTDWSPAGFGPPFQPTSFIDITEFWPQKAKALALYGDEMRSPPHARSIDALRNLALRRGASVGLEMAEAFVCLREITAAGMRG